MNYNEAVEKGLREFEALMIPPTHAGSPPIKDFTHWHSKESLEHLKSFLKTYATSLKESLHQEAIERLRGKRRRGIGNPEFETNQDFGHDKALQSEIEYHQGQISDKGK